MTRLVITVDNGSDDTSGNVGDYNTSESCPCVSGNDWCGEASCSGTDDD